LQFALGAQSASPVHGMVLQAPAAQAQGEQLDVAPATQSPAPSHLGAAAMFCLPLHDDDPQMVPAGEGAQLPPPTAHEVHTGQVAEPQHTLSTQWPLRHCGPLVHAAPFALRVVHAVPTHDDPLTQSPSPVHVVRHALAPHTNGLQLVGVCVHAPAPLHAPVGVSLEPVHEGDPHEVVVGAFWHAPAPLHAPVKPQGGAGWQRPCGSAAEGGTSLHAPARPATLHAMHVPQVEVVQHTPSTQKLPVRHSSLVMHAWPSRFLSPHELVLRSQMLPAAQLASEVQVVVHAAPSQAKGAHGSVLAARQLPAPSQVRARVWVVAPTGHDPGAHVVPAA
jgi:hypothetical protein